MDIDALLLPYTTYMVLVILLLRARGLKYRGCGHGCPPCKLRGVRYVVWAWLPPRMPRSNISKVAWCPANSSTFGWCPGSRVLVGLPSGVRDVTSTSCVIGSPRYGVRCVLLVVARCPWKLVDMSAASVSPCLSHQLVACHNVGPRNSSTCRLESGILHLHLEVYIPRVMEFGASCWWLLGVPGNSSTCRLSPWHLAYPSSWLHATT